MKRTRSTASLTELQPKEPQPKPKKLNTSIVGGSDAVGLRIPQSASHRVTVDFDDFIDKEFIDTKLATYVIWDRHGNKFTYLGQRFTRLKNARSYLWRALQPWLENLPHTTITFSMPICPSSRLQPQDFKDGPISVDPDLWDSMTGQSEFWDVYGRIHVQIDASLHEDDCACSNCGKASEGSLGDPINHFSVGDVCQSKLKGGDPRIVANAWNAFVTLCEQI